MASAFAYEVLYEMMNDKIGGETLGVLLVNGSDAFDKTTDKYVSDVDANELTGGNYTRKTLTGLAVTKNTNSHATWATGSDVTWTALTGHNIEAAYVFINTGSDSTSEIIAKVDGANIQTSGGDVTLQFSSTAGFGAINA